MAVRYRRPVSHAATWSSRLAVFALLILVVAAVAHRLGLMQTMNFISLGLLATGLAALALLLALTGLASLWFIGARGRSCGVSRLRRGAAPAAAGRLSCHAVHDACRRLREVSTDTDTVPDYLARPRARRPGLRRMD
jgi:hypothetical protein